MVDTDYVENRCFEFLDQIYRVVRNKLSCRLLLRDEMFSEASCCWRWRFGSWSDIMRSNTQTIAASVASIDRKIQRLEDLDTNLTEIAQEFVEKLQIGKPREHPILLSFRLPQLIPGCSGQSRLFPFETYDFTMRLILIPDFVSGGGDVQLQAMCGWGVDPYEL